MSLTIEQALMSQGAGYQYAVFQTKLISIFFLLVSLNSFFTKLSTNIPHLAPKSPEGLPRREDSSIICFKLNQNGQNATEDALLASFHIINIVELSARGGIHKTEMTRRIRSRTVVGNGNMHHVSIWNLRFTFNNK
jgi:hypothetical protein